MSFLPLRLALALILPLVASCTLTRVNLDYHPTPGSVKPGPPRFAPGLVTDLRDLKLLPFFTSPEASFRGPIMDWARYGPHYLGTVRLAGPALVEHVFLTQPATVVVQEHLSAGLNARGMLSSSANQYTIEVEILEFYCDMDARNPHASAKLRVGLRSPSGTLLHLKQYTAHRQSLDHYPGAGDPVVDLRLLAGHALQDALDAALDDPSMRRAAGLAVATSQRSSPK